MRAERHARKRAILRNAQHLLKLAGQRDNFDGNFVALAYEIGWHSGPRWFQNPAIGIAAAQWQHALWKQNRCLDCEGPLVRCTCRPDCPGGMCAQSCGSAAAGEAT